jgi:hypothetical protein
MFKIGRRLGIRAKAGLISAVFRKVCHVNTYYTLLICIHTVTLPVIYYSIYYYVAAANAVLSFWLAQH